VLTYMERFVNTLGADSVGGIGSPVAGIRTFPDEDTLFASARNLGQELCRSIADKSEYPEQAAFREGFKPRMAGLVDVMQEFWPYEREYWGRKRAR
jgi:hypothetical protein